MAGKGGYGYPPGNVPPQAAYPSAGAPPPYTAAPTTVIIQQTAPVRQPVVRQSHGILGFMDRELNAMGRMVDRELGTAGRTIETAVAQNVNTNTLGLFLTNNAIQLISKSSGKALQIVMSPMNTLVLDGCGVVGAQAYNAIWTVVNEGKNQIRLQNNNNYIAIVNGNTVLVPMAPGQPMGIETKFQLTQVPGQHFISLESVKEPNKHIGVLATGQLKPALATGKGEHAQFAVTVVHSPYAPPAGTVAGKH